jgi:glycosyltransferase involved in cell wall biosynthesis
MPANPAVESISAFFPCYNDAPTIATMVRTVQAALEKSVDDYEIIVVNDGSSDASAEVLAALADELPLRVVTHEVNRGYGAALISGFGAATKQWVFYTDGDAQYDAAELTELVRVAADDIDLVQGVKVGRGDPLHRRLIGRVYHHAVRFAFRLKVHDTDCDFRLIRRTAVPHLTSTSGVICVELMRRMQVAGARFVEVPVSHYERPHGRSQFFRIPQLTRAAKGLAVLWWRLIVRREPAA